MKRGHFADIDTEYEPLNDEQRAKLRTEIEVFYKGFVQRVAEGRKRKYDDVEPLAQGRVWTGAQAKQNGLVDEIGGIDRAIEMVKQKANIAASEKITLVAYPPRRNLLQVLLDRDTDLTSIESRHGGFADRSQGAGSGGKPAARRSEPGWNPTADALQHYHSLRRQHSLKGRSAAMRCGAQAAPLFANQNRVGGILRRILHVHHSAQPLGSGRQADRAER